MLKSVFGCQAVVCTRFVDRIEIFPLNVLDQGDEKRLPVGEGPDDGGDRCKTGLAGGEEPALSGDDLISLARGPEENGLKNSALADGGGQLLNGGGRELTPRLRRIPDDLRQRDVLDVTRARVGRTRAGNDRDLALDARWNQRLQSTTKCFSNHGPIPPSPDSGNWWLRCIGGRRSQQAYQSSAPR